MIDFLAQLSRNERQVLNAIWRHGPIARAELVDHINLTTGSLTRITQLMAEQGLLTETVRRSGGRGNPMRPLEIRAEGAYAFGVNFSHRYMDVGVVDLSGALRGSVRREFAEANPEVIVSTTRDAVDQLMSDCGIEAERVLGLCFAAPGEIRPDGRGIYPHPYFTNLKDIDLIGAPFLATGATVRMLPGMQVSDNVVTYEEQILDGELPGSVIIGGSGAIGVEFAYVMANFGVDVTIVEFLDRMVPTEDADISKELAKHYKKLGVKVLTSTAVKKVEDTGSGVKVTVAPAAGGDEQVLEAGKFLAAFGFAPRVKGYGLENTGVSVSERGAIEIDDFGRTNVDNVYAIGDCTGKMMLAHVAEAMGIVAAETINGAETMPVAFDFVPRATYCNPQVASFGYSEAQAKEKGYDVKTASFPFTANGKAMGLGEPVGFVKVVADAEHNEIIGAHMIGPNVTELLPVLTMAQQWDLTADEVARNVFAHPTLGEAVKEAVHGIAGHMINF